MYMIKNKTRIFLFLLVCFPARLLFAYIARYMTINNSKYLKYLSIITFIMGSGFILNYINNKKIGSFGQKVWWNNYRLIHGIIYITYSLLSTQRAYYLLFIDAILGLIFFINNLT